MYGKYTIALCDILGFSDLINSNDIRDIVEKILAWFRKSLHHSLHKNSFPEYVPPYSELQISSKIGIAWFSDTLILYTRQDSDECIQELFGTLGWLLFETMLYGVTRLRGGISYGEAFIDTENSLYVGHPIIEAYKHEQRQQWSGASLDERAVERLPMDARTGRFVDWWVVPYSVPLKDGSTFNTLAIDWTIGIHSQGIFLPWSETSPEPTDMDWKKRRDICEKWKNTKQFHDQVCRLCNH